MGHLVRLLCKFPESNRNCFFQVMVIKWGHNALRCQRVNYTSLMGYFM